MIGRSAPPPELSSPANWSGAPFTVTELADTIENHSNCRTFLKGVTHARAANTLCAGALDGNCKNFFGGRRQSSYLSGRNRSLLCVAHFPQTDHPAMGWRIR